MIETGVDVLLALLHARGASGKENEPILGITRLQKLLFLLWKEGNFYKAVPDLYNFKAYDFGPCMDDLYDDLEFTESIGLVNVDESAEASEFDNGDEVAFIRSLGLRMPKPKSRRDYYLSDSGIEASTELFSDLSAQDIEAIENIKRRFNLLSSPVSHIDAELAIPLFLPCALQIHGALLIDHCHVVLLFWSRTVWSRRTVLLNHCFSEV